MLNRARLYSSTFELVNFEDIRFDKKGKLALFC